MKIAIIGAGNMGGFKRQQSSYGGSYCSQYGHQPSHGYL